MGTDIKPIVRKISDSRQGLRDFYELLSEKGYGRESDILLEFPIVYIHNWKDTDDYEIYIGETNNIVKRTGQHYDAAADYTAKEAKWQRQLLTHDASLYIIGHEHFNKSMTLDIENRLMLYMTGSEHVRKIHNLRGNPQNRYYPDSETDSIFRMIWRRLHKDNRDLFPSESAVRDSAVFKASPLHRLTESQEQIKQLITGRVFETLRAVDPQEHDPSGQGRVLTEKQLIFVEGEAGTGKTVLNSSAFYEIFATAEEMNMKPLRCCMLVNHDEQIVVYRQIAEKLGLTEKYGKVVYKPTTFINHHTTEDPVDIAFVDEAHLLLTQGKQSYQGDNQLKDIIERARIIVVMFDENQILTAEQYWESQVIDHYRELSKKQGNYFELKDQLRIKAPHGIVEWIDDFTKKRKISKVPDDNGGYEIRVFEDPFELEKAVREKALDDEHKLSRLIATYDWEYNFRSDARLSRYWEVVIGKWHRPWNRELEKDLDRKKKKANKTLSWAEQPQTIGEIGSTFTIQGFDLNYAGVILGPSVKYRNGEIVFDPEASFNKKAVRNRTLSDGSKRSFGEKLIQHEVRVLMTRGVEGLYIYACDDELRKALLEAAG